MYKYINLYRAGRKLSTCNLAVYLRSPSSAFLYQGITSQRPDKSTHKVSFHRSADSSTCAVKETVSSKQDRLSVPGAAGHDVSGTSRSHTAGHDVSGTSRSHTAGHDVSGTSRSHTGGARVDSSSRQPAPVEDHGTVSSAWSRYVANNVTDWNEWHITG